MTADQAQQLLAQLLMQCAIICAPLLSATLFVGLLVSLFQVITQLQEMSLSYIPKLVVTVAVLGLLGPWMMGRVTRFASGLFQLIPALG
ncbi:MULTISPECIES: flagellar biosynthetic protein FliQ [Cupriavidus]|uniref:flagellar biosynthetic protein FliQ n=1 Tax=Cupriavidus sp. WS TaxID=1312922 RepID=UPI00048E9501|nr:flagellar biosynthetic protein FliQ [Cupriavidus sp. WS]